jgi:high-affinity iron transporter
MLVLTGVLVGVVLVVMTGGTALTFQELGWLPSHSLPIALPEWLGSWFEIYPTYETIACQLLAATFVVGSYFLAQYLRVVRPRRAGLPSARPADSPPVVAHELA